MNTSKALRIVKTTTMLAVWLSAIAIGTSAQAKTTNPFAGTYCGYLDSLNYGSMSISDSGHVTGYFSYHSPMFSESFSVSGRVTAVGVMRLRVVHTITVRDRGVTTFTERYSVTVTVVLDELGNLVATSGATFVLSPCQ